MQIKIFAQQTNLAAKTIRYYEEIGLLPPPRRLNNGYRLGQTFPIDDVEGKNCVCHLVSEHAESQAIEEQTDGT